MNEDAKTIEELISSRLAELPDYVKHAIASVSPSQKVAAIAQQNNLHVDQAGVLEQEVLLSMLGITDPNAFADELVTEGGFERVVADKIAGEVAAELFLPIRDAMRRFTDEEAAREEKVPALPAEDTQSAVQALGIARIQPGFQGVSGGRIEKVLEPPRPVAQTAPEPSLQPKPRPALVHNPLEKTTVSAAEVVDVGLSKERPASYRTDPYREPAD